MTVIDAHQHFWNLECFPYSWCRNTPELNRSFLFSDYLKAQWARRLSWAETAEAFCVAWADVYAAARYLPQALRILDETFQHFWTCCSPTWAGKFLDAWCRKVSKSRLAPLASMSISDMIWLNFGTHPDGRIPVSLLKYAIIMEGSVMYIPVVPRS